MDKRVLRKEMLEKRSQLSLQEINEKSKTITNSLLNLNEYNKSQFIFTFISFKDEVDTHEIIKNSLKKDKRIGVPITVPEKKQLKVSEIMDFDNELELSYYNILAPKEENIRIVAPELIDLVLVPGVIFDRRGYRVGYGGGYYDRFFSKLDKNILKIGLCYDMQIQSNVPTDCYDIAVDYILTEKEFIKCNHKKD